MASSVQARLEELGVEEHYHEVITDLCAGVCDYLSDIAVEDLDGLSDSNGRLISKPVARGLVRKLTGSSQSAVSSTGLSSNPDNVRSDGHSAPDVSSIQRSVSVRNCSITLCRGAGDYGTMMRCAIRGQLSNNNGGKRRKILTAILDNSGSMRNAWPLVVDAITRVFTDEFLHDPLVSLNAIAYNTQASEVVLPSRAADLSKLLLKDFAPGGITNFQAAFQLAEQMIRRDVERLGASGVHASSIDVTTLLFTDGEDTSMPPHGTTTHAATAKARAAGDKFRAFLSGTGCAAHTCIAAFGQQHNPEQCQYLSDRYFYINRQEVLSEWLTGGLSELLEGAGHCSLQLQLPPGLTLAEPIPPSIGLDAEGRIEYEAWLVGDSVAAEASTADVVEVRVEDSGSAALQGSVLLTSASVVDSESLDGRLFILDAAEMQLRQIARELRGRRPSKVELALLRERLVGVKVLAQPVLDKASDIKVHLCGRALLLARVEELETRRNRLSYALGHFDEDDQDTRNIGTVGIDAILRDASQRVALSGHALALARRADSAAMMSEPEELSLYAQEYTTLARSESNARDIALMGDACFYLSTGITSNGPLVSYDVFSMLSQGGAKPIKLSPETDSFTHVGIPLYCSKCHFQRTMLVLPSVLRALSSDNSYKTGTSEKLLLTLLANALATYLDFVQNGRDISLFHQARAVAAVFENTMTPDGKTLLDTVLGEASTFISDRASRGSAKLFEMAAIGLLAHQWSARRVAELADAIVEEATQRAVLQHFRHLSESERLGLAWSLLGPAKDKSWLEQSITGSSSCPPVIAFNILDCSGDLEKLHKKHPQTYAPRDSKILTWLIGGGSRVDPIASQWAPLRALLSQWSLLAEEATTSQSLSGLWELLDNMMLKNRTEAACPLEKFICALRIKDSSAPGNIGQALVNPTVTLGAIAEECLRCVSRPEDLAVDAPPRLVLASVLRSVVAKRTALAQKYPIKGSQYPSSTGNPHPISRERMQQMWGACAHPTDKALFDQARHDTHRKHNTLPLVVKEALTDKEYRRRGGRFAFPTHVDTFIPGLHRRTKDLHAHWQKKCKSNGTDACDAAVKELLLRMPWDDDDENARSKLSKILANIWNGLENPDEVGVPVSSALWLDDEKKLDAIDDAPESHSSASESDDGDWKHV